LNPADDRHAELSNALGAITDARGDATLYTFEVRAEAKRCFEAAGVAYEPPERFEKRSREQHRQSPLPAGVRNLGSTWESLQRALGSTEPTF